MQMQRLALIRDGVVMDVIDAVPTYEPPTGYAAVPAPEARLGDAYDGTTFTPASLPTPFAGEAAPAPAG